MNARFALSYVEEYRMKRFELRTKIALLAVSVVLFCTALITMVVVRTVTYEIQTRASLQALNIARTASRIPEIRQNLGKSGGERVIQPIAESIRRATGAESVVAIDMSGRRYSHPVPERIGQQVVGGDEWRALAGEEYTSTAVGTLGQSFRGWVPVYDMDGLQVGALLTGVLTTDVAREVRRVLSLVYAAAAAAIVVGVLCSMLLANHVKRSMLGLEPHELAALLKEREAILASVREGIIAVNHEGIVTMINDTAKRLTQTDGEVVGRHISEVIPNIRLPHVLESGEPELDREQLIGLEVVVTNRLPIKIGHRVVGAVASFREKSEMTRIAEELLGTRRYVESLRVQAHEFKNRLHTIIGLIQMGRPERAVEIAAEVSRQQQSIITYVGRRISIPSVAAILIGKAGRAQELGIDFKIEEDSSLGSLPSGLAEDELVTVIGNLVENAFEATEGSIQKRVSIGLLQTPDGLEISVWDTGPGVSDEDQKHIWEPGFSTKPGGQGIGLALVRQYVTRAQGSVRYYRQDDWTCFEVYIPRL